RSEIVAAWLDEPDEKGTYDAHYEPLAIEGDVHVAQGWSRYFNPDGSPRDEYINSYVCRFDDDGRCTDFIEYWIQNREMRKRALDESVRKAMGSE
ncbi:MAG: hypothetical protein ACR2H0_02685, partial [Candidatus Limnocylindrales bacterium]